MYAIRVDAKWRQLKLMKHVLLRKSIHFDSAFGYFWFLVSFCVRFVCSLRFLRILCDGMAHSDKFRYVARILAYFIFEWLTELDDEITMIAPYSVHNKWSFACNGISLFVWDQRPAAVDCIENKYFLSLTLFSDWMNSVVIFEHQIVACDAIAAMQKRDLSLIESESK